MESSELALRMTGSAPEVEGSDSAEESAQLLKRVIAGDSVAFEQIILRYERRVLMTAWRLLGHREDAQDAAQEVFLRLYKYRHHFDQKRALLPWLYRMTVNVCHDVYRKRRQEDALAAGEMDRASLAYDPGGEITRSEQRRIIEAALEALTEKERAAVVLRDIEGLTTKDVAGILGSSETTVRSQISTARVKIRKFVDKLEKKRS
ncbi:MAG TPA: RNA polymerase sigma factor [Terriglobia bacterium]|nr:RNA polymerase sigma factor [Terriglobia bacterium]